MSGDGHGEQREVQEVLLVEDNLIDAQLIRRLLRRITDAYYRITHVRTLNDAVLSAEELAPDVILADLNLPDSRGTQTVSSLQTSYPDVPLVIVSAWEDEAISLRSVKAGAQDYLVKGHIDGANLHRVIRYAVERKRTELELVRLAQYDQLTSLPNRTLLRERVDHALRRAMRSGTMRSHTFATIGVSTNVAAIRIGCTALVAMYAARSVPAEPAVPSTSKPKAMATANPPRTEKKIPK